MIHDFFQSYRQRIKGFCRPRHSFYDHKRSFLRRLHQRFLKKVLPCISWRYSVWCAFPIFQRHYLSRGHSPQMCFLHRLIRLQYHELIFHQLWYPPVPVSICLIQCLNFDPFFSELLKSFLRHEARSPAAVLLFLRNYLLCTEVLGFNPQDLCFHPQNQVFRHQYNRHIPFRQPLADLQNTIVRLILRKAFRQHHRHAVRLHPQEAPVFQFHSFKKVSPSPELFQEPDHAPCICSPLALRLLQSVQLLQNHQRKDHLVILEALQRIRRLDQYIRVDDIALYHTQLSFYTCYFSLYKL